MTDALEFYFAREPGGGKKVKTRIIGNNLEQLAVPRETLIWNCDLATVQQIRFAETRVIATVARELVLSDASGPIFYVTQTVWANIGQISGNARTYYAACGAVCRRLEAMNPEIPTRLGYTGNIRWFGFIAGLGGTLGSPGGAGGNGSVSITWTSPLAIGLTINANVQVNGNLTVAGSLAKGSGSFAIDDPADPANKILYHSFVESPHPENLYNGTATLDQNGEVTIQLPAYFDALNERPTYQYLALYQAMPNLYIKTPEGSNQFTIGGGAPRGQVSWHITGVRHDPYILRHPSVEGEVDKGPGQPVNKGQYIFKDYPSFSPGAAHN